MMGCGMVDAGWDDMVDAGRWMLGRGMVDGGMEDHGVRDGGCWMECGVLDR